MARPALETDLNPTSTISDRKRLSENCHTPYIYTYICICSVYYSVLTVFWVACLQIFFKTLPDGRPK